MTTTIMRAFRRTLALALAAGAAVPLSACAPNQEQPLIFVSRDVYGVSLDTSPSATGTVGLTLGYSAEDVSLVPVTVMNAAGDTIYPVRGCYTAAQGPGLVTCSADSWAGDMQLTEEAAAKATGGETGEDEGDARQNSGGPGPGAAATARGATHSTRPGSRNGAPRDVTLAPANRMAMSFSPGDFQTALPVRDVLVPVQGDADTESDVDGAALATADEKKQVMHDSLSVYSSFDSDVDAGGAQTLGVSLGKVFATGVAAQQLTEGQNYYLQFKGRAEYAAAVAACVTAAKDAVGGTISADVVRSCAGRPVVAANKRPGEGAASDGQNGS
ncbi:hypothetical protein C882_2708 [Caenispirillum salinarum AK4]|uniref:Secreted protein n=1 Tax=Caenispirillum salinarum AK4 TaxID=1238182 RepID=K9H6F8_9PROT|nr:hypothetical protein [Caenispirillum salinarum]EKV32629.1 hypothetical protein C882_2708 [Caenispirillum salinarum AK4]